jgi:hypothetical protein
MSEAAGIGGPSHAKRSKGNGEPAQIPGAGRAERG